MKWIGKLFKKKAQQTTFIMGSIWEVRSEYFELLNQDVSIISTTLSQDFERYGNSEKFVLIVTYIRY